MVHFWCCSHPMLSAAFISHQDCHRGVQDTLARAAAPEQWGGGGGAVASSQRSLGGDNGFEAKSAWPSHARSPHKCPLNRSERSKEAISEK